MGRLTGPRSSVFTRRGRRELKQASVSFFDHRQRGAEVNPLTQFQVLHREAVDIDGRFPENQSPIAQIQRRAKNVHDLSRGRQAKVAGALGYPRREKGFPRGRREGKGKGLRAAGKPAGSDPLAAFGLVNQVGIGHRSRFGGKRAQSQQPEPILFEAVIDALLEE